MRSRIYRDGKYKSYLVKDLDEAYRLGFFNGSMTRYELMDRITRFNPSLRWYATATHRGLWDTNKGENGFICGITHNMTIPKWSLLEYHFGKDRKLNYVNMFGEATGSEIVNDDEFEYKALARGWEITLNIVEKNGYKIDWRGIK